MVVRSLTNSWTEKTITRFSRSIVMAHLKPPESWIMRAGLLFPSAYWQRMSTTHRWKATLLTVLEVYEPFTNVATDAGITTGGTGSWGDFDNDGDVDLFVSSKLYVNEGNGTFSVSSQEFSTGSAIWVDVDNDGDLDLYTHANSNGNAKMYINNAGNWSEQSSALSITPGESASWGDYDQDGDLDLFLTRTSGAPTGDYVFRNNGTSFSQVQSSIGLSYSTFGEKIRLGGL